jgi:hypothetical protein
VFFREIGFTLLWEFCNIPSEAGTAGSARLERMTFFESPTRAIFLFEHDLCGKPVSTFADHL